MTDYLRVSLLTLLISGSFGLPVCSASEDTAAGQAPVPFVLPWDDAAAGPTDLSFLRRAHPLPLRQIVVSADGHLAVERENESTEGSATAVQERIRLFGVNICAGQCFPKEADADVIARRLAKFGVNCVRLHHMDAAWARPRLLRDDAPGDLDPDALKRLDGFIAALRRNGIYVDLNLLVARSFHASEGLPPEIDALDWKTQHVVGMFHPRMIELQKEYARALLTHRNPLTGLTYAEDPAVAVIEILNENGLIHAWLDGSLDELSPVLTEELRERWNAWLRNRYPTSDALAEAWGLRIEPIGAEMLENGDFAADLTGWLPEQHEGAEVKARIEPSTDRRHQLRLDVRKPGKQDWHVQLGHAGLSVRRGALYTLRFRARAEGKSEVGVALTQAGAPWGSLAPREPVKLTETWRNFALSVVPVQSEQNARVLFTGMGSDTGSYRFANVSLKPGGSLGDQWLRRFEAGSMPIARRAGDLGRPKEMERDYIAFLWEVERGYWREMRHFLEEDLKVKALVMGSILANSPPLIQSEFDAVDSHAYWQHPRFPRDSWNESDWTVDSVSMVDVAGGALVSCAMQNVAGKPHLVTEYNHASPNAYASEAPLLLAMMAGFQDWDGIFFFDYKGRPETPGMIDGFFDVSQHPGKMANLAAAALMFRRGDIMRARTTHTLPIAVTAEQEIDRILKDGRPWRLLDAGFAGVSAASVLVHRFEMASGDHEQLTAAPAVDINGEKRRYASDTGEIVWDLGEDEREDEVVTLNAPRAKAVVGFADGRGFDLGDVRIQCGTTHQGWCTISLVLTEGDSFTRRGRALLVATGLVENTDMGWKNAEKSTVGRDWGKPPTLVEVIPARVTLMRPCASVKVWALDDKGQRARQIPVHDGDGMAVIDIGRSTRTLFYEIELD